MESSMLASLTWRGANSWARAAVLIERTTETNRMIPPSSVLNRVWTARVSVTSRSISNSQTVPTVSSATRMTISVTSASTRRSPDRSTHRTSRVTGFRDGSRKSRDRLLYL